jgi:copper chaperone CopZ
MKNIFFMAAMLYAVAANSQVSKVSIQASGLTCSMCSNAINKALKNIDFVEKVDANIKTSTFEVTIKPKSKVDFEKLKSKVEDAGFFVSTFIATIHFNNVQVKAGEPLTVGDQTLQVLNTKDQILNGDKAVRIVSKGFVSTKEFKRNAVANAGIKGTKIYHVTIS